MIDILIWASLGSAYLYEKFIKKKDWTIEDAKNGLIEIARKHDEDSEKVKAGLAQLADAIGKQEQNIERIQAERSALASEVQRLRELDIKRQYGGYIFGAVAVVALILAIFNLLTRR
jgi:hypothetical protein